MWPEPVFDREKGDRQNLRSKKDVCTKSIIELSLLNISLRVDLQSTLPTLSLFHDELRIRKFCFCFIAKFLTGEMFEHRPQCCKSNLKLLKECESKVLDNNSTEKETSLTLYVLDSELESIE